MAHELQPFYRNLLLLDCFLHTLLVAFEEVGAGVPGTVALKELLGEPAVEALVVLTLHVGAGLSHAVPIVLILWVRKVRLIEIK